VYKTERLELRLTESELKMLDIVRGPSTRSAWIRNQILRVHTAQQPGPQDMHSAGPEVITKQRQTRLDQIEPTPSRPLPNHRHKPGTVIEEWFEKGQKKTLYRCTEPTCTETMVR
jgi:hypothetical protein